MGNPTFCRICLTLLCFVVVAVAGVKHGPENTRLPAMKRAVAWWPSFWNRKTTDLPVNQGEEAASQYLQQYGLKRAGWAYTRSRRSPPGFSWWPSFWKSNYGVDLGEVLDAKQ